MDRESPYRILYLEDNLADVELVRRMFRRENLAVELYHVMNKDQFQAALEAGLYDLVLTDLSVPGFAGTAAIEDVHKLHPDLPVVIVSGTIEESEARKL